MNDQLIQSIYLIHLFSTLYMVGLIWFVQIVHYPLLEKVGISEFLEYERVHVKRTTWVVSPMFFEVSTALLLTWIRPAGIPTWAAWTGLLLLLIIWLSTVLIQVPCHRRLEQGFDIEVHRKLVYSNWIRTICWSLRGFLVIWVVLVSSSPISTTAPQTDLESSVPSAFVWSRQP
ncbi:hypothetical protein OAH05_02240 [bacterium]|nr:hypothetical protein [bacterium]MDB4802728.1 hypothetical protein [bacterium]